MIGADAVEVGQHQRIGEEDRVVEERLRRHQAQADERALRARRETACSATSRSGVERRDAQPDRGQRPGREAHDRGARNSRLDVVDASRSPRRARPCVISQRGDSGSHSRMKKMTRPSAAPIRKASAPAQVGRQQRGIEQHDRARRADRGADPEAAVDDEVGPAAIARRHEFLDGRVDGGVFAADAGAGEEAKQREAPQVPGQRGRRGGDEIDRERDEEQPLAPEPVGEPAEEQRAQHRAGEIGAAGEPDVGVGEVELRAFLQRAGERRRPASPRARRGSR